MKKEYFYLLIKLLHPRSIINSFVDLLIKTVLGGWYMLLIKQQSVNMSLRL